MKNPITKILIIIILCAHPLLSAKAQVQIRGARSCGQWVSKQTENKTEARADEAWLVGFLSGMAYESNKDFLQGADNPSLFLWVTNYCRNNPLDHLSRAGEELSIELSKKRGINR